jgi:hypothetical protein
MNPPLPGSYLINNLVKQHKVLINILDIKFFLVFDFSQLRLFRPQNFYIQIFSFAHKFRIKTEVQGFVWRIFLLMGYEKFIDSWLHKFDADRQGF